MSLESLTPEEKKALQDAQNAQKLLRTLLTSSDEETKRAAQRLLKKADSSLNFPDLEAADAAAAARAESAKEVAKLREELAANQAAARRQEEDKRIRDAGYDPEKVRKLADEKGVADLDFMVQVLQSRDALSEPTHPSFQPMPETDLKQIWDNPDKWLHETIEKVHNEFTGRRGNPLSGLGA